MVQCLSPPGLLLDWAVSWRVNWAGWSTALVVVALGSACLRGVIAGGRESGAGGGMDAANLLRGHWEVTWPQMSREARRWHQLRGLVTLHSCDSWAYRRH